MADEQIPDQRATPRRTEATPPKVPGAEDSSHAAWAPGTAAEAAPDAPMPPTITLDHDDAKIAEIKTKVADLQREIDRLLKLVNTASKKLKDEEG